MGNLPTIIQGGMGAGVSSWRLAQAVCQLGRPGVVSGTTLDLIFARRLQDGDPGGHMRRGLDHFPIPQMAELKRKAACEDSVSARAVRQGKQARDGSSEGQPGNLGRDDWHNEIPSEFL